MARQTIKDNRFTVIGYIDTDPQGRQTALDAHYRHVGYYDPNTDKTKNAQYQIVGSGNQLSSLIHR